MTEATADELDCVQLDCVQLDCVQLDCVQLDCVQLDCVQLDCVEVVVTGESADWLAAFTRSLVEARLVACGHNIAPIRAVYRWEGRVHDEQQARVGLHTRRSLVPAIVAYADREHADDVPCVIAIPIVGGHPAYLQWIYDETRDPDRPPG